MNLMLFALLGVLGGQPYLPAVGPVPLRFVEPPPVKIAVALPATAPIAAASVVVDEPVAFAFTVSDLCLINNRPATVEELSASEMVATRMPGSPVHQAVTPEMFVELFRRLNGQSAHHEKAVGVPLYFAPPRVESPRSSTATYRSE